jgi:bis(5'-nucleosyl)-tetraphosphatase (symmetrical)
MATYAIGDVQGCYDELRRLLAGVRFDEARDYLWFVGDLVNRGPKSRDVLRFVSELGERAVAVLGNHDLHLVSQHAGLERTRGDDSFADVLDAPDAAQLVGWLRARPLLHLQGDYAMVHAGLLPQWSLPRAAELAGEVEEVLQGKDYRAFLANMYGSTPDAWSEALAGWDRLRVIVNAMTRLRFCTPQGRMDLRAKGRQAPPGHVPWYELRRDPQRIVCGHWSALGLKLTTGVAAIDTGCVWGGQLSALRLEDGALFQVACARYQSAGGDA